MNQSLEIQELVSNYLAMNPWARKRFQQVGEQYRADFPAPGALLTLVDPLEEVEILPRQVNGVFNRPTVVLVR